MRLLYSRIVGKVIINETDIKLKEIRLGMAWSFKRYQNEHPKLDRQDYATTQEYAKKERQGLWADNRQTPP